MHWPQVIQALSGASLELVTLAVVANLLAALLKAIRWKFLIPSSKPGVPGLLSALMAGYTVNNVLPFKAGEVTRAVTSARRYSLPIPLLAATVVTDRAWDALGLVVLLTVSTSLTIPAGGVAGELTSISLMLLIGITFLVLIALLVLRFSSLRLPSGRFKRATTQVQAGLLAAKDPKKVILAALLTLLSWGAVGLGVLACADALQIYISIPAALFLAVVANLGGALPAAPGGIGAYHYGLILGVSALNLTGPTNALTLAVLAHASWYVPLTLIGAFSLFMESRVALKKGKRL